MLLYENVDGKSNVLTPIDLTDYNSREKSVGSVESWQLSCDVISSFNLLRFSHGARCSARARALPFDFVKGGGDTFRLEMFTKIPARL